MEGATNDLRWTEGAIIFYFSAILNYHFKFNNLFFTIKFKVFTEHYNSIVTFLLISSNFTNSARILTPNPKYKASVSPQLDPNLAKFRPYSITLASLD